MYRLLINITTTIVGVDFFWKIIKPIVVLSSLLISKRNQVEEQIIVSNSSIYPQLEKLEVMNGLFKGMKYPSLESVKSSLYPKLIGSYERELYDIFEIIKGKNYSQILDVGCAEGYYAVGLGLIFPQSKVFGYDTDERARELCFSMAELNGLENRLFLKNRCTSQELNKFTFDEKSLIVCDCEGFEKHLFTSENIGNLKNVDVLVETHDFIDIEISDYLESLFSQSHMITKVKSLDDLEKARTYDFEQTKKLPLEVKRILFKEGRPQIMEWFFCEPKNSSV